MNPIDLPSRPSVRVDRLTKRFGRQTAVDDVSFAIEPGQTFGLLGPNGAGKSTTIRMLVGLAQPDEGSIELLGQSSARRDESLKRRIGYVPEQHNLYRWMTVQEILRFTAKFYPRWSTATCDELLERFQLPLTKKIRHLSKGMTAKLGLLLALAPSPDVLLMDEPTSGLDPLIREELLESILATGTKDNRRALMYSSHHIDDVARVADVIGIMDNGRLVLVEQIDKLHDRIKLMRAVIDDGSLPNWMPEQAVCSRLDRREWSLTLYPFEAELAEAIADRNHVVSYELIDMSLEDTFKQIIRGRREAAPQEATSC